MSSVAGKVSPLASFVLTCAFLAGPATASDLWTATCSKNGRPVFQAKMPKADLDAQRFTLPDKYPDATCVFLGPEEPGLTILAPPDSIDGPDPVAAPLPGHQKSIPVTGATGLDAALKALRGTRVAPRLTEFKAAPAVPAYAEPEKPSVVFKVTDYATMKPSDTAWVRLGIYRGAAPSDVMADWRRMIAAEPAVFASLTPAIDDSSGDAIMLVAGPVPPGERDDVCAAAYKAGADCLFGGEVQDSTTSDIVFGTVQTSAPACVRESGSILAGKVDAPSATLARGMCWRSPFALAMSDAFEPLGVAIPEKDQKLAFVPPMPPRRDEVRKKTKDSRK